MTLREESGEAETAHSTIFFNRIFGLTT